MAALALLHSPADAAVLLSDSFTSNSGTVPSGWSDIGLDTNPGSTIVESGSVVTITDTRGNGGPQLMQSSVLIAPEALSLTVGIDSMTSTSGSDPQVRNFLGSLSGYGLMVQFSAATKNFSLAVLNNTAPVGTFTLPAGTHLPSYSGGAFAYTLSADLDSVRLTSTLDSFDSGDLLFSSAGVAGFDSLDDLGSSFSLLLGTESGGSVSSGTPAAIAYDYVNLIGTSAVPEPSRAMLLLPALAGIALRRRRR